MFLSIDKALRYIITSSAPKKNSFLNIFINKIVKHDFSLDYLKIS